MPENQQQYLTTVNHLLIRNGYAQGTDWNTIEQSFEKGLIPREAAQKWLDSLPD